MDRFEKLDYRIKAGIRDAKDEKTWRLSDRVKLPLKGLHPVHILSSKAMCVSRELLQMNSCP